MCGQLLRDLSGNSLTALGNRWLPITVVWRLVRRFMASCRSDIFGAFFRIALAIASDTSWCARGLVFGPSSWRVASFGSVYCGSFAVQSETQGFVGGARLRNSTWLAPAGCSINAEASASIPPWWAFSPGPCPVGGLLPHWGWGPCPKVSLRLALTLWRVAAAATDR